MKDCIDIHGFSDVIIYSEWVAKLVKDENGKTITKAGEIVPHSKVPSSVSLYQNRYDYEGRFSGVELITIPVPQLIALVDKITAIKNEPAIDAEYHNDDLPF